MARCRRLQGVDKPHNPPYTYPIHRGGYGRCAAWSVVRRRAFGNLCAMDGTSSGTTGFVAACHDDAEERKLPGFHEG